MIEWLDWILPGVIGALIGAAAALLVWRRGR